MATPSETIDLSKILTETRLITKSHALHFQTLSIIFLLPLSFSILIYPILHKTIFNSPPVSTLLAQVLVNLLYILFVTILSVFGVVSITYSTFHVFCCTPVELITSIKSISKSFFPLVITLIIQELSLALISWPLVYQLVPTYSSESFYKSDLSYMAFVILLTISFLLLLIYILAKWILVPVIVVVESKWGLEPMKRSAQLVKGKKGVAFSMVLLFGLAASFWVFYSHGIWGFISSLAFLTMLLLPYLVAIVVLYIYCIEMHGEELPSSSLEEVPLLK